jgi:hypothetical protein
MKGIQERRGLLLLSEQTYKIITFNSKGIIVRCFIVQKKDFEYCKKEISSQSNLLYLRTSDEQIMRHRSLCIRGSKRLEPESKPNPITLLIIHPFAWKEMMVDGAGGGYEEHSERNPNRLNKI